MMNAAYTIDDVNLITEANIELKCAKLRISMLEARITHLQIAGHMVIILAKSMNCDGFDETGLKKLQDIFNGETP